MWIYKSNLSADKFLTEDSSYKKQYLSQLESEYIKYKDAPIKELSFSSFMRFHRGGDRLSYENEYFERRKMLRDCALTAWLYNDKEAAERMENILWAVCNEFTWVLPAHLGDSVFNETIDLFAAETAQTIAEIISLMEDRISDEVKIRCAQEIRRRVLDPFINRKEPYNWESMRNNWCAVCGGCIGMAAIYLIEDTDELRTVTDSLEEVMASYLSSFSDDGACLEGLYYWNYGMMYFTAFLDLYKQRMGFEFTVDTEKVKKMAEFPNKCLMGGGFTVSFSDGSEKDRVYAGLAHKLAQAYGSEMIDSAYFACFDGDNCGRWCKAARDIAWTENKNTVRAKVSTSLPQAQWTMLCSNNMSVAFKGGNNGEPHNHNDVGSFSFMKNGEIVLCDLGAGEYTAEYFSDNRYKIMCNRSSGHSVPLINGAEQKTGSEFTANGYFFEENCTGADISGAYEIDKLKKCLRTIKLEDDCALVEDVFEHDGICTVTERFITRHSAVAENGAVKIILDGRCIGVITPHNDCAIQINTHIHYEHDGGVTEVTSIDFIFEVSGKSSFLVKMS